MDKIKEAVKVLNQGGIVVYPTDTAFGIGCRIDNESSIKKLFEIRRRPKSQAVPVLVSSIEMAKKFLLSPLPNNVRHLMERYWPGALTIVYPCKKNLVPSFVRGKGENLGVRMPNHKTSLSLIESVGVPILGPSANFHEKKTPYKYDQLDKELVRLVDYVIAGKCKMGNVSTVVDCSTAPWKIIRDGAVKIKL
jgi:L-threonylcarbamoyladenylate synthase